MANQSNKQKMLSIIALFFIAIMIFSSIAYIVLYAPQQTGEVIDGGLKFSAVNNMWKTQIDGRTYDFFYLPNQVNYIQIDPNTLDLLSNAQSIAITLNASTLDTNLVTVMEHMTSWGLLFDRPISFGQLEPSDVLQVPTITCANATSSNPVIFVQYANESSIVQNNNCITISGTDAIALLQYEHKIRYMKLGVDFNETQ